MPTTAAVLLLAQIGSGGPQAPAVELRDLLAKPQVYKGRRILLRDIACAATHDTGFICLAYIGSTAVWIEAGALGARTAIEIAESMIGPCKGLVALDRLECRVQAEFVPIIAVAVEVQTPKVEQVGAFINARSIDFYARK